MTNEPKPTNAEAKALLEQTLEALEHVFDAANSADEKSRVFRAIKVLGDERVKLEVKTIQDRDGEYKTLTEEIKKSKKRLEEIKDRVDDIVAGAETAARIISTLGAAIALVARFAV